MEVSVMIVDDHQIVREGLRSLLEKTDGIKVVCEASNGRDCVSLAMKKKPDIVIMDISMPEMNGLEATRKISQAVKGTKVLALSMTTDRRQVQEMLRAGARGFLIKDSAYEELIRAIQAIQGGHPYLSPTIQGIMMADYVNGQSSETPIPAIKTLTSREREILQLLADGVTVKAIAEKLDRCVKTIETHRANIMDKLELRTVPQLTKYAIQEGLTSLDQ